MCLARVGGRPVATASTSIQYLAAGRVGPLRAIPSVLRTSDSLGVAEVRVVDAGREGRLMAAAHATCRFLSGDAYVRQIT
jgi:acyl-coenzyme A thioesterase PaaI-like protein